MKRNMESVYDLEAPVLFFPIRHHSPACSYHLGQAFLEYKPDIVLIEGPSDTDRLIPFLTDDSSQAPLCIYFSFRHKDENGEKRASCYYPMMDYSPELHALRLAKQFNVEAHFIDLPYGNLMIGEQAAEKKWKEVQKEEVQSGAKTTYFDDYFLLRSQYIKSLCEKENCRNYSELWEKLFELNSKTMTTEQFVNAMYTLCYYSRVDYPEELFELEQCHEREHHMAHHIKKYMKEYQRVMVVTGGFHTPALIPLISQKLKKLPKILKGEAYLIPYSFAECDQLSGYASGMPYPSFYQHVWEQLISYGEWNYKKTVLYFLIKLGALLRKRKENISISDESAAFQMAEGLSFLRGKQNMGVYEMLDGVRSAYVKGELNIATSFVLKYCETLLKGDKIGKICDDSDLPPIVEDFKDKCDIFHMNIKNILPAEATLDIVSKQRHREQSAFLHRLEFLKVEFAKMTYGPDYRTRENTKLVREKWKYTYSGKTVAYLIEVSMYGGTVAEAAKYRVTQKAKDCNTAAQMAELLTQAAIMGITEPISGFLELLTNIIMVDGDFVSLTTCAEHLSYLCGIQSILHLEQTEQIASILSTLYRRICTMISELKAADEKEDSSYAARIKGIYTVTVSSKQSLDTSLFTDALAELVARHDCPPSMKGSAFGLLYGYDLLTGEQLLMGARQYFYGTNEVKKLAGRYLKGVFLTAKDALFYSDGFLEGLQNLLSTLDYTDFLEVLPDLRLAFTYFTPREIVDISKKVVELNGEKKKLDLTNTPIDEQLFALAKETDLQAYKKLDLERGDVNEHRNP